MSEQPPDGNGDPPGDQPADPWVSRRTRLTLICAWCRRYQAPDGTWQPGRRATDATAPTHGICPDCLEKFDAKS
jgi:hypothetical protein